MSKKPREVRERIPAKVLLKGLGQLPGFEGVHLEELESNADYYLQNILSESGDLETDIKKLKLILSNAKKAGYPRVELNVSHENDGYSGTEISVLPFGYRPETNEERVARERSARKRRVHDKRTAEIRAEQKEVRERENYERLKKKFGS